VGWIHNQAKTEDFIQSLRDFVSYLITAPGPPSSVGAPVHKFPPFLSGTPNSTRRAVIAALEDALIAHDGLRSLNPHCCFSPISTTARSPSRHGTPLAPR
jgi:hypothetical protein